MTNRNDVDPLFPDTIDFRELLFSLKKRIWLILVVTTVLPSLAAFYVVPLPWKYTASAEILIEAAPDKVISIDEVDGGDTRRRNREFLMTGAEILASRANLRQVVERLDLTRHPVYDPASREPLWYEKFLDRFFRPDDAKNETGKLLTEDQIVTLLSRNIEVNPVRRSQLVEISVTTKRPELSADIANEIASVYIETERERRVDSAKQASDLLTTRLRGLKQQLEEAEKELTDYLAEKPLDYFETLPQVMNNPVVQRFREAEADAERRISELGKRYGPEHPKMVAAKADLDAIRTNLAREIRKTARSVAAKVGRDDVTAATDSSNLSANIDSRLHTLEREVITNRHLYNLFLSRVKETNLLEEMSRDNARIVEHAIAPSKPSGPRKTIYLLIALTGGLAAGIGAALLLEKLDTRLNSPEEVEDRLNSSVLGIVPEIKRSVISNEKWDPARESQLHSDTVFAESIRNLRTAIRMSLPDNDRIAVLVTSSVELEGKTTISTNLALSLGQMEGRTLLVDADLRRPAVADRLQINPRTPGFTDFVTGQAPLEKCISTIDRDNETFVLTAGTRVPNPQELLSSQRVFDAWQHLREQFEFIVIDSAPVLQVGDTLFIADKVNMAVLTIRANSGPYKLAQQALAKLKHARSPVVYTVLNRTDIKKLPSYYRHGYYDGYGTSYT